jgi:hypothetical protein
VAYMEGAAFTEREAFTVGASSKEEAVFMGAAGGTVSPLPHTRGSSPYARAG